MRLLPRDALMDRLRAAGFEARFTPDGFMRDRGLLLARRPGMDQP